MNDLQLYELYCSIPLWKPCNQSRIYPDYVVLIGRAFRAPHPHRHYILEEFIDKLEKNPDFKQIVLNQ